MSVHFQKIHIFLLINVVMCVVFYSPLAAAEKIPDDIRYMLLDMYGANKSEWPSVRYNQDLNQDGFPDWIVKKKSCSADQNCPADIFICIPDKAGKCSEYCYLDVKNLAHLEEDLKVLKCESSC